jgi:hypothetical protein
LSALRRRKSAQFKKIKAGFSLNSEKTIKSFATSQLKFFKIMDCEFLNPVDFQGNVPTSSTDFWNFKNVSCSATSSPSTLPEYISKVISSSTPEKIFYISNTIDYGQVLILGFFVLAFLFAVVLSISKLVFKK